MRRSGPCQAKSRHLTPRPCLPEYPSMADRLLLASASPRRRDLLNMMGIAFDALASDSDESIRAGLPAPLRVMALAEDKARAVVNRPAAAAYAYILAADTLVWLQSGSGAEGAGDESSARVFGKPSDAADARRTLEALSGRSHTVSTGLCLFRRRDSRFFKGRSDSLVHFAALSPAEIDAAIANGDWKGVAGSYRIQGYASRFIERIEGSWSGIVGLPIHELYVMLGQADFDFSES